MGGQRELLVPSGANEDPEEEWEYESDEDPFANIDPAWREKHRVGANMLNFVLILAITVLISSSLFCFFAFKPTAEWDARIESERKNTSRYVHSMAEEIPRSRAVTLGTVIGLDRQYKLQATIMAIAAWLCVVGATFVAAVVVTHDPEMVPADFEEKGTLSNVCQDVSKPHGRMFTVALFTSAMLLVTSMYTFWIYRAWQPWHEAQDNPLVHNSLTGRAERRLRTVWIIFPQVGFMFTAAIPSLSDSGGYKFYLMLVHNVCAPLAMAMNIIMETVQLRFGENAFEYFWTNDPTPLYGPLSAFQRARVICVSLGWFCCAVFLSVQVYLGAGSMLGFKIKKSYKIALVSFFSEVGTMIIIAGLPALAGLGLQFEDSQEPAVGLAMTASALIEHPKVGNYTEVVHFRRGM